MRSKKGITLVSLVVTIILLIILAGVSINLTLGENGIITVAKKARENMELATIEEQTQLNTLYTQIGLENENIGGIDNNSISKLIEFKQKVASAITDMGIETLETANADTMANNIRNIVTNKDASSISYDNTNSELSATNVQGAVDELNNSFMNETYYQQGDVVDITWWCFFYGFKSGNRFFITTPLPKKITRNSSFDITGFEIWHADGVFKYNTDELLDSLTVTLSGNKNGFLYLIIDTAQDYSEIPNLCSITGQIRGNLVVQ